MADWYKSHVLSSLSKSGSGTSLCSTAVAEMRVNYYLKTALQTGLWEDNILHFSVGGVLYCVCLIRSSCRALFTWVLLCARNSQILKRWKDLNTWGDTNLWSIREYTREQTSGRVCPSHAGDVVPALNRSSQQHINILGCMNYSTCWFSRYCTC